MDLFSDPVQNIALGPGAMLLGGCARGSDKELLVAIGDVVVWGGPSRLTFHGIDTLKEGQHEPTGVAGFRLTFRRAG
jgi:alkylated DNA repair protein (DNA oxidative demethylase)